MGRYANDFLTIDTYCNIVHPPCNRPCFPAQNRSSTQSPQPPRRWPLSAVAGVVRVPFPFRHLPRRQKHRQFPRLRNHKHLHLHLRLHLRQVR